MVSCFFFVFLAHMEELANCKCSSLSGKVRNIVGLQCATGQYYIVYKLFDPLQDLLSI